MIFDCFIAYDEIDMIRCRQAELAGRDVTHLCVEATTDHRGRNKPCHVTTARVPGVYSACWDLGRQANTWEHEKAQRDALLEMAAQQYPAAGDLIIAGDVDEIVRGDAIDRIYSVTATGPVKLGMRMHCWGPQWVDQDRWSSAVAFRWQHKPRSITDLRGARMDPLPDCGWHLTWFGGVDKARQKLATFTHNELDRPEVHERIPKLIDEGITINGFRLHPWYGTDLPKGCPS